MSCINGIRELINNKQRRLQKLKERKAIYGINTPPEVLIEIEDTEAEIKELQTELEALESCDGHEEFPRIPSESAGDTISQGPQIVEIHVHLQDDDLPWVSSNRRYPPIVIKFHLR